MSPISFTDTLIFETVKGIMIVPCAHEGEVKNFLFDTGAQVNAIQREQIKGKRLNVRGASNRTKVNGSEIIKSLKINDIDFKNTFATNDNMGGLNDQIHNFGGLIGRPIISRANWLIDNTNKILVISSDDLSDDSFVNIPLDMSEDAPYTFILLDSLKYKTIIDLGSSSELNVPQSTELANYLLGKYDFNDHERDRYTVGGTQIIVEKVGIIPLLQIGEKRFENVKVSINESSKIRIGMNLFKNSVICIDGLNKRYYVK